MKDKNYPGHDAVLSKGWLGAHRWLLWRRLSQIGVLGLFLLGPWAGVWIIEGNLSASRVLDTLPLTDPYVLLQSLLAGHWPAADALIGAGLVLGFYLLAGGRVYCSWLCPLNLVTDAASGLRERLELKPAMLLSRQARYWLLALSLALAAGTGSLAWELVNPVSLLHRGIIFGMGLGWAVIAGIFLFDLFVARHGWCGHLCPAGAFYSLLGRAAPLRVSTAQRAQCNDCLDCFRVCPEPQVITPALKNKHQVPLILGSQCSNCGRCIDVCSKEVFSFTLKRFAKHPPRPDLP